MNEELERLARELELDAAHNERLRFSFAFSCTKRVMHLLEQNEVRECLDVLGHYLDGMADRTQRERYAAQAKQLANRHRGSASIDGCGHAAVSASFTVAHALAGNAIAAAEYAAYAAVYGQGGHGAVAERASFEPEFAWQVDCLESLARRQASP